MAEQLDGEEEEIVALLVRLYDGEGDAGALAKRLLELIAASSPRLADLWDVFAILVEERRRAADYQEAIARAGLRAEVAAARMPHDEAQARSDLRLLLDTRGAAPRHKLIRSDRRRFRTPQLVEKLLDEACTARRRDPREAVHLLELALDVAARVSRETYGADARGRLITRIEAHRANALRVACEMRAADTLWCTVHARLRRFPPLDELEAAEYLSLEASLRTDQRRFAEAEALLADAEAKYRKAGDATGVAKVLMKRGLTAYVAGEPAPALTYHKAALAALSPGVDPRMESRLHRNLAMIFAELGEPESARAHLELDDLSDEPKISDDRSRHLWVEGLVELAEGQKSEAETHLLQARSHYLARGGYEAAQVSIDLAILYQEQGQIQQLRRLAEQMDSIFEMQGLHRETLVALLLFQRRVLAGDFDLGLLSALRRYLRQARRNPAIRFGPEPPESGPQTPTPTNGTTASVEGAQANRPVSAPSAS